MPKKQKYFKKKYRQKEKKEGKKEKDSLFAFIQELCAWVRFKAWLNNLSPSWWANSSKPCNSLHSFPLLESILRKGQQISKKANTIYRYCCQLRPP